MGPLKQLKRMFEPTRLIATIVMLVSILCFTVTLSPYYASLDIYTPVSLYWKLFVVFTFLLKVSETVFLIKP